MTDPVNSPDLIIFLGEHGEERHEVRKEWYNGELYYSIVDIIAALKVSQKPPRQYWSQLKEQIKDEGFIEAKNRIVLLRLKAADGRFRQTDCANQETLLRLFQSIRSPRVEPIKQWLARTGSEKIDEIAAHHQPEADFERMVHGYIERGYEPEWAWTRAQGDLVRNELTDEWTDRGATNDKEFAALTNIMHKGAFDLSVKEHKVHKSIPRRENLRDHLTITEHGVLIFTETIGISLHRKHDTQGFIELQRDAFEAGKAGKGAREIAEATLGEPVVSSENYMHLKQVKGRNREQRKRLRPSKPDQKGVSQIKKAEQIEQTSLFDTPPDRAAEPD